ncbi:ABC transporter permease [Litoreibacter albidus]|uniref:NitT/TauT family transport system permease protein n=1 Tax=Litoreibacter albidus TaxID=670155 RepID=A0A1H2Y1Y6_9RHOB|nr:ABC transporter permease subunit [Litoreibacter albidus]SDW99005.1 NitT/TauT family transport system permease protein [Litoreibacter albidus]
MSKVLPVLAVVASIFTLWYAAVPFMNVKETLTGLERAGTTVVPDNPIARRDASAVALVLRNSFAIPATYAQERPRLPAPHQVAQDLWETVVLKKVTSKRSLVYHGWITLSATLLGFTIGTGAGILLAVGIVHSRAMDMSVMPWAIASQTIPILAIAPMIIVVLNSVGIQGVVPKAIISAYLSFFPVVVGMVKGLRAPDAMQLDLLKTYNASGSQGFWKLRLPASMPYLFASLKIGVAAALVGAIVAELPAGGARGLGGRMLTGSYYGQMVQIWSALVFAAVLAASLVLLIGWLQNRTLKRMGLL